jgi:D-3-phosphoglycerate dehydrogenase
MKILVADKIAQAGIDYLRDAGFTVEVKTGLSPEELEAAIVPYDAVAVRSAVRITRQVIEAGTNLKVIGRAGVGIDNIDKEAASERGVRVLNTPRANIVSAAEQTFALMLACARNTAQANASMHAGRWDRASFTGSELYDKTLAIFGFGKIGSLVAERAAAFGMKVIAYDPFASEKQAESLGVELVNDFARILPRADIITIHLPKKEETLGLFDAAAIAQMKDGVIVLNVARGGICVDSALAGGLDTGKIAAVGIDVYETEPPGPDYPLLGKEKAVLTPHLGASTVEAQRRAGLQLAEYMVDALREIG